MDQYRRALAYVYQFSPQSRLSTRFSWSHPPIPLLISNLDGRLALTSSSPFFDGGSPSPRPLPNSRISNWLMVIRVLLSLSILPFSLTSETLSFIWEIDRLLVSPVFLFFGRCATQRCLFMFLLWHSLSFSLLCAFPGFFF